MPRKPMKAPARHRPSKQWATEDRHRALAVYAVIGTATGVERELGIPERTVAEWTKQDWWVQGLAKIREEKSQEHRQRYSDLVDAALAQARAKLPDAGAKDALMIAAISTDKIRLFDSLPTSISANQSGSDALKALAQEFARLSDTYKARDVGVVAVQEQSSE